MFMGSNPIRTAFSLILVSRSRIAQLVERLTVNQKVLGSNPSAGVNAMMVASGVG